MSSGRPKPPDRFVSIHNHTSASPYDGLGYPSDHFEWCMKNGIPAHAITEHGNFNSLAYAQLWLDEWSKKHKDQQFKYLPGIEAYFHPDLEQWRRDKDAAEQAKEDKKAAAKLAKQQERLQTRLKESTDADDEVVDLDVESHNALTIENEDETKSISASKFNNPVNRRHHLVLLPKNGQGLQELFHATSRSYLEGFFRFPRMDRTILKQCITKGNVVASTACIGGLVAWEAFRRLQAHKFDQLSPSLLDDPIVMDDVITGVGNAWDTLTDIFGIEDTFLELQFNRLPAQDVVNRAILEFSRRNGLQRQLIVTCDAHYYSPDVWREREIYKKLGYMNYTEFSPDALPKSRAELKCELYPKNATQLWDEYCVSRERSAFYESFDDDIRSAVEHGHDVAFERIGEAKPDKTIKLPKKLVPAGSTATQHLIRLCIKGLKARGKDKDPVYVERLKYELDVIDKMQMPEYFITLARILDLARDVVLLGPGRGSGAGSLVNYVLKITDIDPIKWNLSFHRFMNLSRCLDPSTFVQTLTGVKKIDSICVGDHVMTHDNSFKPVIDVNKTKTNIVVKVTVCGQQFRCTPNHKWVVKRDGDEIVVTALELKKTDMIMIKCK